MTVICEQAGIRLKYSPPYSPDLNPIETSFSVLKTWIKIHQCCAEGYAEAGDFAKFLYLTVKAQSRAGDPGSIFRNSGIYHRSEAEIHLIKNLDETDDDDENDSI